MNKKETEFNQNEYIKQYEKEHYNKCLLRMKPNENEIITNYCADMTISKNKFAVSAMMYIINNNIPLSEYYKDNKDNNKSR